MARAGILPLSLLGSPCCNTGVCWAGGVSCFRGGEFVLGGAQGLESVRRHWHHFPWSSAGAWRWHHEPAVAVQGCHGCPWAVMPGLCPWAVMPGLCPVQGSWHLEGSGAAWLPQSCAGCALEARVCAGCMEGHCPQGSLRSAALRRAGMKDAVPEKQVR